MGLSEEERRQFFKRAGGQCECTASSCSRHAPGMRCTYPLAPGFWDVSRRYPAGTDRLSNFTAMCAACLEETAYMLREEF